MSDPKSEFDAYGATYQELLNDPVRNVFAGESRFFHQRKWWLIRDYLQSQGLAVKEMSWLDVGCGQGDLLKEGARYFKDAQGCDMSAEMLGACEGLNVWVQPEGTRLPVADQSFDFVTAVCVYHHVPVEERAALTQEVARLLKPGGVFCIIEHNPFNPATQLIVSRTPVDANAILLRSAETTRLMRQASFLSISVQNFLYVPAKLYRALGWIESPLKRLPLGGQYAVFARRK